MHSWYCLKALNEHQSDLIFKRMVQELLNFDFIFFHWKFHKLIRNGIYFIKVHYKYLLNGTCQNYITL